VDSLPNFIGIHIHLLLIAHQQDFAQTEESIIISRNPNNRGNTMRTLLCLTLFTTCLLTFLSFSSSLANSGVLAVRYNTQIGADDEQAKWNAHINNQAYLRELEQGRRFQTMNYPRSSSTVIINRSGNYNCRYRACDSWGFNYKSGSTSFSYQEGYQPTRIMPVFIVPHIKQPYKKPYHHPAHRRHMYKK
jgi:hypothetical protein